MPMQSLPAQETLPPFLKECDTNPTRYKPGNLSSVIRVVITLFLAHKMEIRGAPWLTQKIITLNKIYSRELFSAERGGNWTAPRKNKLLSQQAVTLSQQQHLNTTCRMWQCVKKHSSGSREVCTVRDTSIDNWGLDIGNVTIQVMKTVQWL